MIDKKIVMITQENAWLKLAPSRCCAVKQNQLSEMVSHPPDWS